MLEVRAYDNAAAFFAAAGDRLNEFEDRHSLLIGVARRDEPGTEFWTVEDRGRCVFASLQSPGRRQILGIGDDEAVAELAREVAARGIEIPGVVGLLEATVAFADAYGQVHPIDTETTRGLRLHRLDRVAAIELAAGSMRYAQASDLPLVGEWGRAFHREIESDDPSDAYRAIAQAIDERRLAVWEHEGQVVSMAGITRSTDHGVTIYYVYSPTPNRGRGFATAVVAELTRAELEGGRDFVTLFTDLANPVSNKIYARIGYRPIGDWVELMFARK